MCPDALYRDKVLIFKEIRRGRKGAPGREFLLPTLHSALAGGAPSQMMAYKQKTPLFTGSVLMYRRARVLWCQELSPESCTNFFTALKAWSIKQLSVVRNQKTGDRS